MTLPGGPGRISRRERIARAAAGMPAGHPELVTRKPGRGVEAVHRLARRIVAARRVHRDPCRSAATGPAARNVRPEVITMAAEAAAPEHSADGAPDELLLTVEEAARRLRLGRTLVYRLISSGQLESVTVGRLRRIPAECLAEYVATLRRTRSSGATMAPAPPEQDAPGPQRSRNSNYRSTIYQDRHGRWVGRVTMGVRDNGRADRRHVRGATRAEVARKVRDLERERDSGRARAAGQRWTVTGWLEYWIVNVAAPPHVAENTHLGYRVDVNRHLVPGLGAHRLEKLSPEHVERFYAKLQRDGMSPGGAHHVHRTLRAALNEAVRRSHLTRNPVLLAKAPKLTEEEVEPYGIEEIKRLLDVANERRNSARWALALALGLRQGEALGLRWEDVDLDRGVLHVRRSRLRPRYAHGCGGRCDQTPGTCPQRVICGQRRVRSSRGQGAARLACRPSSSRCCVPTGPSRSGSARKRRSSGTEKDGCLPAPSASRSSTTPISANGSGCSGTPGCVKPGCMTRDIQPRPCCCSSAYRPGP